MTKQSSRHDHLIDNLELQHILKKYDPTAQPSQASMASLEANIFAQIDNRTSHPVFMGNWFPVWILNRDWSSVAAIAVMLLIVVSGFVIDRNSYDGDDVALLTSSNTPTLLALADENSTPQLSATLWGEDDDNDQ